MSRATPRRRHDPRRAKIHRSYSVAEAATLFGVHRNTVRNWIRQGLQTIQIGRAVLILGEELRRFLSEQRAKRRAKCAPGSMYCVRCRSPQRPPDGLIDAVPISARTVNLRGLCPVCGGLMFRRANLDRLLVAGFGHVLPTLARPHMVDNPIPSLVCHSQTTG